MSQLVWSDLYFLKSFRVVVDYLVDGSCRWHFTFKLQFTFKPFPPGYLYVMTIPYPIKVLEFKIYLIVCVDYYYKSCMNRLFCNVVCVVCTVSCTKYKGLAAESCGSLRPSTSSAKWLNRILTFALSCGHSEVVCRRLLRPLSQTSESLKTATAF